MSENDMVHDAVLILAKGECKAVHIVYQNRHKPDSAKYVVTMEKAPDSDILAEGRPPFVLMSTKYGKGKQSSKCAMFSNSVSHWMWGKPQWQAVRIETT